MDFVMVPVPEELAFEVQQFIMQADMRVQAAREKPEITADQVLAWLPSLREPCRRALGVLAAASLIERHQTIADLAEQMGWSPHEASGVVHELNELVWHTFGPVMTRVAVGKPDPQAGTLDWASEKIVVAPGLGQFVGPAEERLAGGA